MDQTFITRIVEAALLAAHQPLTLAQLHALFPEDQPAPADSVEHALETLRDGCAARGVELVELASGFRYQVQADVHPWVARLWTERQTRYTRATLETLALIAYRQPITRGEIEQVRGVAVSSNIIKALEEREWIRVVGHRDVPGKPALFGTTKVFLDYFGLKRLDELPPLSELKELGELEPQFQFDGVPDTAKALAAGGVAVAGDTDANADDDLRASLDSAESSGEDGRETSIGIPETAKGSGEISGAAPQEHTVDADAAADIAVGTDTAVHTDTDTDTGTDTDTDSENPETPGSNRDTTAVETTTEAVNQHPTADDRHETDDASILSRTPASSEQQK